MWLLEDDHEKIEFFDDYINMKLEAAHKLKFLVAKTTLLKTNDSEKLMSKYVELISEIAELKLWAAIFASQCVQRYRKKRGIMT